MFNAIIRFSLNHRLLVLTGATILMLFGMREAVKLPIDVLPDLNRPRVAIMTECPGMAPEEVETIVTTPLESAVSGATGVIAVRSNSTVGLSVITIEFDWDVDVYKARQIVTERLMLAAGELPEGITPQMTPISSVMGQIMILALWDDSGEMTPRQVRTIADWTIRKRLQTIPGVSEVFTMGGERKQFQVLVRPEDMLQFDVSMHDIEAALTESNRNVTGGYLRKQGDRQLLVRALGRVQTIDDIKNLVVKPLKGRSILMDQVATVTEGAEVKFGDSSGYIRRENKDADENAEPSEAEGEEETAPYDGGPAVLLTIGKQPDVDTRRLTGEVIAEMNSVIESLRRTYPGLRIESLYQQRAFIDLAIHNVIEALWLGAILVAVALLLFLMNIRTTLITLIAMPLSIVTTCLVFAKFGLSINTMTLGGLAVAIGELVDDAIVDVENIYRRLRENFKLANPLPTLRVVYNASREIRNSIVYGTLIVVLVFFPLFFLSGIEGRLFRPLGIAYVVSILSSLVVSLTVTPVLSHLLLPPVAGRRASREGFVMRSAQAIAGAAIRTSLAMPRTVLVITATMMIAATTVFLMLDRDFMPRFNEGAIQLNVDLMPDRTLDNSVDTTENLCRDIMEQVEGIQSIARKTGRAELDEHAIPVTTTEMICGIDPNTERSQREIQEDLQKLISAENLPGTVAFDDQPLQHLIDHLRAGTKAQLALKIQGDDLALLKKKAERISELIADVPGIHRTRIDPNQNPIGQLQIRLDYGELARYGLRPETVYEMIETAMNGRTVSEVVDGQRFFDLVIRLDETYREDIEKLKRLPIWLESGEIRMLDDVADIDPEATGPHQIDHEGSRRQVIIQISPKGRAAVAVKDDIMRVLEPHMKELTAGNYTIMPVGLFQSESEASQLILGLSALSLVGIFLVLMTMFKSSNLALQVMAALPCALIGAVVAIYITGQDRTVPNLVGMVSLCGIASRNGILLLDHYFHLVRFEGWGWTKEMLVAAGRDRVAPVVMTALTSALGLVPLVLAADQPGREILYPIATVVIGGLISSTLMEFFLRPALFWLTGRKAAALALRRRMSPVFEGLESDDGQPIEVGEEE